MRKTVVRLLIAVVVLGALVGAAVEVRSQAAGDGQPAPGIPGPSDPHLVQCQARHDRVCNPTAEATFLAINPAARPPAAHPRYISRAAAVSIAVSDSMAPASAARASIHAELMSRPAYERLDPDGINAAPDPRRLIWVVTVHADAMTMGGPARPPEVKHVYTVVIDAATGLVTDVCVGCATLG